MLNFGFPNQQYLWVVGQQYEVVYIAQVSAYPEGKFDELVQFVELHVGKKLAGEATDVQSDAGRGTVERLVQWYMRQQQQIATFKWRRVYRGLHEDGIGYLVKALPRGDWPGQLWQGIPPQSLQNTPINTRKKGSDVELAIPTSPGLTHELLQACDRCLRAFASAVGVAVVDETLIPPGLNVSNQPLLYKPVSKRWGKYLSQLGVGDGEDGEWLRLVAIFGYGHCLFEYDVRQVDEVCPFMFAVPRFSGALEKLS